MTWSELEIESFQFTIPFSSPSASLRLISTSTSVSGPVVTVHIPAFSVLAPGSGMVTVFTPQVGKRGEDDEQGRRVVWTFGSVNEEENKAFGAEMYASLTGMLERGELKPNNIRVLDGGLAAVPAGCDQLEKGVSGVKLVVRIRD